MVRGLLSNYCERMWGIGTVSEEEEEITSSLWDTNVTSSEEPTILPPELPRGKGISRRKIIIWGAASLVLAMLTCFGVNKLWWFGSSAEDDDLRRDMENTLKLNRAFLNFVRSIKRSSVVASDDYEKLEKLIQDPFLITEFEYAQVLRRLLQTNPSLFERLPESLRTHIIELASFGRSFIKLSTTSPYAKEKIDQCESLPNLNNLLANIGIHTLWDLIGRSLGDIIRALDMEYDYFDTLKVAKCLSMQWVHRKSIRTDFDEFKDKGERVVSRI